MDKKNLDTTLQLTERYEPVQPIFRTMAEVQRIQLVEWMKQEEKEEVKSITVRALPAYQKLRI